MTDSINKPKSEKPSYNPKYEKNRKQKPISFSLTDEVESRLIDLIAQFEFGTYLKGILAKLSTAEQKRIIGGDFLTIPLSLIKHNIAASGKNITHFFTIKDAVQHFDQDELASHLSDDALLKELANRNLVREEPTYTATEPYSVSEVSKTNKIQFGMNGMPVVNEFGTIEIQQEDGTTIFLEPEKYLELYT
jgi:hypothetical protein